MQRRFSFLILDETAIPRAAEIEVEDARAERVVPGLDAPRKPEMPSIMRRRDNRVAPAGEDLVRIGLVPTSRTIRSSGVSKT